MSLRFVRNVVLVAVLAIGCNDGMTPTSALDEFALKKGGGSDTGCNTGVNDSPRKLLECVTLDGVRAHQARLQSIADQNGGTRAAGTVGHALTEAYIANTLSDAGYEVVIQPFQFDGFVLLKTPVLAVHWPSAGTFAHVVMTYSGSGNPIAPVSVPSDVEELGCNPGDFATFPSGHIALIHRGVCTFELKATNAYGAGAAGVIIWNNVDGELRGTLSEDFTLDIPVTGIMESPGNWIRSQVPGIVMEMDVETLRGTMYADNVIASSTSGDPGNVIMAGAYLDGASLSPAVQNNGSGVAALLEVAVQMSRVKPRNQVRFAFWGGHERYRAGSDYYVVNLMEPEREAIAAYVNVQSIGSPNHGFFVLDGDDSEGTGWPAGPDGSGEIESLITSYYNAEGIPVRPVDPDERFDVAMFQAWGIPVGGIYAGGNEMKSADEVSIWGGVAGVAYDPCYGLACDTYDNVSLYALDINADAVAYTVISLADERGREKKPKIQTAATMTRPSLEPTQ